VGTQLKKKTNFIEYSIEHKNLLNTHMKVSKFIKGLKHN